MLAELNQAEKRNYKYDPNSARAKGRPYRYREVVLQLNSPGLVMLRQLRDEAHRFAISFHRKVRSKRAHGSILDEVPGIGPKKKRLLLRTFGSVEAIRRATVEEIAAVPTLTLRQAGQIKDILQIE
jgi:excinuclease ABC subunit C